MPLPADNPTTSPDTGGETGSPTSLASAPQTGTDNSKVGGGLVFGACIVGILVSNTQAGPIALGILSVALIFQLNQLLTGK